MVTFLDNIIEKLNPAEFKNLVIVLPNQRAGIFLKQKLVYSLTGTTNILPEIISIEHFVEELSGLQSIDQNEALLLFYKIYLNTSKEDEKKDFESFISWGQTLLQDFNEIDRYLVDHNSFFNYLYYINDQKHWFLEENKTPFIENYIHFWESLQTYYKVFSKELQLQQKGYQGLQYRKASDNISHFAKKTSKQYIFVGFNALNAAEQNIFQTLIKTQKATVFWDAEASFFNDEHHDASLFLRQIEKNWSVPTAIKDQLNHSFSKQKNIHISGIPKNIGQVKYVAQLLNSFDQNKLSNTALILADEALLIPMLNSLPDNVNNVNITMGLSMDQLPMSSFINQLIELKKTFQNTQKIYHKELLAILQNPITAFLVEKNNCAALHQKIISNNYVYITKKNIIDSIGETMFFEIVLKEFTTPHNLLNDFISICKLLIDKIQTENYSIQLSHSPQYLAVFQNLLEIISDYKHIKTLTVIQQLLNNTFASETVDFKGEPFQGLQIMGVLESRCLDFETIILTSVNEGMLPAAKKGNSFIPYDLKLNFGLPTYKEKDAIYAYHFYRLLQRCNDAYLLYNTQVDELNSGEKSRFLQQIEFEPHSNHSVTSVVVSTDSKTNYSSIEEVKKDVTVIEKLKQIASKGISPSALGTYLRNPLAFYEQYILGVKDPNEVEEEIAANTLGSVIHNVLEKFYKPLENQLVTEDHLVGALKRVSKEVTNEFTKIYSDTEITNGINYITVQAAITYVQKFLNQELANIKSGNEIQIIAIESNLSTEIKIPELNFPIRIYGKVDRVDRLNGQLRIVDYKTGAVEPGDLKITNWESLIDGDKKSKALQILMYAYIYNEENNLKTPPEAGIVSFKKLNEGFLSFQHKTNGSKKYEKHLTPQVFQNFLEQLRHLIVEICDINIPFVKKEIKTYAK